MFRKPAAPAAPALPATGLPAYIAWADRQIGNVIVSERLHAALQGVTEGPTVLTFRLRLLREATERNIDRLLRLDSALAHALHVAAADVRLMSTSAGILVQIPHPQPWTPRASSLSNFAARAGKVVIGLDENRKPVYVDLHASPHLLAVGPTRRGKTEAVKATLAMLTLDARPGSFAFVVLAKKFANWQALGQTAACVAVITDPAEQEAYARWLVQRLDERTGNGHRDPLLVTVLDDAHDLTSTADVSTALARVAGLGAAAGLLLFATTQTTGRNGGVGGMEHNFATRLVFGAADASAAARFAGSGGTGADRVGRTKGDALLIVDGATQRVATALCEDDWILSALPPRSAANWPQPWKEADTSPIRVAPVRTTDQTLQPAPINATARDAEQGVGEADTGPDTSATPVFAPPAPFTPIPGDRFPTSEEIARIRSLRSETQSLNQTCALTYGPKNTRRAALVKWACNDPLTASDHAELSKLPPAVTLPAAIISIAAGDETLSILH